jgi:hypothetical protein
LEGQNPRRPQKDKNPPGAVLLEFSAKSFSSFPLRGIDKNSLWGELNIAKRELVSRDFYDKFWH